MEREIEKTSRLHFRRPPQRADEMRSFLVVREGRERGARLELTAERAVLGREPTAALRLLDAGVSGTHCAVWKEGGVVWIEDLASSNGTFVDERPIVAPTPLPVGSEVGLGRTILRHEYRGREELARESAVAADLDRAASYVAAILPPPLTVGAVRVAWRYLPCDQLGGDAFGYRWVDDDRFVLYLLDVSGHGTPAALHAVAAIQALRSSLVAGGASERPAELLETLNSAFPMAAHGGFFLTVWCGLFDRRDRTLRFASAGHPAPLLRPPGRKAELDRLTCRNPPIGMADGFRYVSAERTVAPGSTLYLFSDGIFEIRTDEGAEWGYEELARVVARPPVAGLSEIARVETDVRATLPGSRFDDDVSLLVVEID